MAVTLLKGSDLQKATLDVNNLNASWSRSNNQHFPTDFFLGRAVQVSLKDERKKSLGQNRESMQFDLPVISTATLAGTN